MYLKDFDSWNEKKKEIHQSVFREFVHTREVWWCSLGINVGFEQDGKHELFERPVLIIKKFNREVVLIVPLTSQLKDHIKDHKYFVNFVHEDRPFSAIISQVRLISTKRLRRKMYSMDSSIFQQLRTAIRDII